MSENSVRRGVTLETFGNDNYGRTIADLLLSDGPHVNQTLVKEGWCWWYRKYAREDMVLSLGPVLDGMRRSGRGRESTSGELAEQDYGADLLFSQDCRMISWTFSKQVGQ